MTADKCGTRAGWNVHQKAGEPQCEDCLEVNRRYIRERRIRLGQGHFAFPLEMPDAPIDGLGLAIARAIRESS